MENSNQDQNLEISSWVFKFYITNKTNYTFTVKDDRLRWGYWYRENKKNNGPISIKPNEKIEVLGIRAPDNTPSGYECYCRWESPIGSINLKIDVPYSTSNSSYLEPKGLVTVDGWKDLPKSGHEFTREIVLLQMKEAETGQDDYKEIVETDENYIRLIKLSNDTNEMMENWLDLKKSLEPVEDFNPWDKIPKEYKYPPKKFFLARSEPSDIAKSLWDGVGDSKYPSLYAKQTFVKRYFAVAAYSINTNPREVQSIAAGVSVYTEKTTEVSSSIKETLTKEWSIKDSLEAKSGDPKVGLEVSRKIEGQFSRKNVLEKSNSTVVREKHEVKIEKEPFDRLFVPWVFSQAILIYREKLDGTFGLVCISEWADLIIDKVYSNK
jgi:hypothetical protein